MRRAAPERPGWLHAAVVMGARVLPGATDGLVRAPAFRLWDVDVRGEGWAARGFPEVAPVAQMLRVTLPVAAASATSPAGTPA